MPRIALVLAGGGARAAWAAGVLHYLGHVLAPRLGTDLRFDVITGTSAGAINGAMLASMVDDLPTATSRLWDHWHGLDIGQVYRIGARQLWRVPRSILSDTSGRPWGEVALADVTPLRRMLREGVDWGRLHRIIRDGKLSAFSVTATELATSRSVVFVEGPEPNSPVLDSTNPFFRPRLARIGPEHVLASAAIPLVFPPVKVGGRFFLDGGLGMNTPLRPALRLGADRVLVLSLRHHRTMEESEAIGRKHGGATPTWAQVVGKTMSAVLLDRSVHEVDKMERVNRLLDWGSDLFGPTFVNELGAFITGERGIPYRAVRPLLLAPSVDLGALASEVTQRASFGSGADEVTIRALRFLSGANESGENDAMSYLLFDPTFVRELLEIGRRDAEANRDALEAFFRAE